MIGKSRLSFLRISACACCAAVVCACGQSLKPVVSDSPAGWVPSEEESYVARIFEFYDANGDGKLCADEYARGCISTFQELDSDGDNLLHEGDLHGQWDSDCQRADLNGDGRISFSEMLHLQTYRFQEGDKDGNGALSRDEVRELVKDEFVKQRGSK